MSDDAIAALASSKARIRRLILKGLHQLTHLSISHLAHFHHLTELDLSHSFPNQRLPSLKPISGLQLTHLILEGLSIQQSEFQYICHMHSIRVLSLRKVIGLKLTAFFYLRNELKNLEKLNIKDCFQLPSSESCDSQKRYFPHLRVFVCHN